MANDVIEEIKENIEKGEEVIEEIVEKVKEKITGKKAVKKKVAKEKPVKELKGKELKKAAEAESTIEEKTLEEKKKELLEKAKKLGAKISGDEVDTEKLKEQVKEKRTDMLVPLEEYVKTGIYLGTRVVTPQMKPFVYRRRADGLAIFNTDLIDEKLKEGIAYLSQFNPEEVILVCKRQAGWRVAEMFSRVTGIRVFTKKYPAGILTNSRLPDFFENELTIVTDSWLDKNALNDTLKVNKKAMMICDTNNFPRGVSQIVIGNNKSEKSLGLIFYLLAKGYCEAKKIKTDIPNIEWWTGEIGSVEEEAKRKARAGAKFGV